MSKHLYNEEDLEKLTPEQKRLVKEIEKLGKKILGEDFGGFEEYMNQECINISITRHSTSIQFSKVCETEVLDILIPNLISRLLGFYDLNDRPEVILKALKKCPDKKEELWEDED